MAPIANTSSSSESSEDDIDETTDEFGFIITKAQHIIPLNEAILQKENKRKSKWIRMVANFDYYRSRNPEKFKKRIRKGVPPKLRGAVWSLLMDLQPLLQQKRGMYKTLVEQPLADPELDDIISRDLGRTLPTHCFFRDVDSMGQRSLRSVLHAYAAMNPKVGYVQGMGFLTAVLLIHLSEEEAFWGLVQLMDKYEMERLFWHGFPLLRERFHQLKGLLLHFTPELAQHMQEQGVDMSFFSAEWFLTLFVYNFPPALLLRVWDIFLNEGWKILFRVALTLLKWEEARLKTLPMELLLPALKTLHDGKNPHEVINKAMNLRLSRKMLNKLGEEWNQQQQQQQNAGPSA